MSAAQLEQEAGKEGLTRGERAVLLLYIVSALAVFVLMMLLGLCMRMAQGTWIDIAPDLFYRIMTAHGAGMVGVTGIASVAVMWFFLRKYVPLHLSMFAANYVLFMLGAVAILASIFLGGYAGGWTFLYPLPVHSMNLWSVNAAALFMLGYLLIGVGFLLFYLDAMLGMIRVYGNLGRALGLQWLFRGAIDPAHPATVVASTMVIITNCLGILGGAIVLVMSLVNAYFPSVVLNALLVKNLTYFFGHVFINATIYMAVIAVYELLPRYSGRPWTVSRPFLWGWAATTIMVMIVYPHHLMMDYAMPRWMLVMGQIISYTSGLPVFVGNGVWRVDLCLWFRHTLEHAGEARHAVDVRVGRGHRAGYHRRHDQRQPGDAQHDVGAGAFPLLPAARRTADGARVHVLPDRGSNAHPLGERPVRLSALRCRRSHVCVRVPCRRPRERAPALRSPPAGMDPLRPGWFDRRDPGDCGHVAVHGSHHWRTDEEARRPCGFCARCSLASR